MEPRSDLRVRTVLRIRDLDRVRQGELIPGLVCRHPLRNRSATTAQRTDKLPKVVDGAHWVGAGAHRAGRRSLGSQEIPRAAARLSKIVIIQEVVVELAAAAHWRSTLRTTLAVRW